MESSPKSLISCAKNSIENVGIDLEYSISC